MPFPKKVPEITVVLTGGYFDGTPISVPEDTAEVGRWQVLESEVWPLPVSHRRDDTGMPVRLWRYAVHKGAGIATVIPDE